MATILSKNFFEDLNKPLHSYTINIKLQYTESAFGILCFDNIKQGQKMGEAERWFINGWDSVSLSSDFKCVHSDTPSTFQIN